MLVIYIENYDGEKITRITKGVGMYCSLSNTKQMCSYDRYFYSKERGKQIPYIRASLLAQMVMNLPAVRETWVRSLGWEEGMATYSNILAWKIPMDKEPGRLENFKSFPPSIHFMRVHEDPRDGILGCRQSGLEELVLGGILSLRPTVTFSNVAQTIASHWGRLKLTCEWSVVYSLGVRTETW